MFIFPTLYCNRIDTPGVIQRVSSLFHGHPTLIAGFNTFLPLGYRIDVSVDPADPNAITVTTPSGTTTQTTNLVVPSDAPVPSSGLTMNAMADLPAQNQMAAAEHLNNLNNNGNKTVQVEKEFNHAIQYLNKIKARYADDQNTYKQFLDILQTYHKEQRHSHDVSFPVFPIFPIVSSNEHTGICASANALCRRTRSLGRIQGLSSRRCSPRSRGADSSYQCSACCRTFVLASG